MFFLLSTSSYLIMDIMKKNKKKEFKYLKQILIPCLSVIVASSIVIPMVVLSTLPTHISVEPYQRCRSVSLSSEIKTNSLYYYFHVDVPKDKIANNLKYSWSYSQVSSKKCALLFNYDAYDPEQHVARVKVQMFLASGSGSELPNVGDSIAYNLHFMYLDDSGDVIWNQTILDNFYQVGE